MKLKNYFFVSMLLSVTQTVYATPNIQQEQLEQARQLEQQRIHRLERQDAQIEGVPEREFASELSQSTVKFSIKEIQLSNTTRKFNWLKSIIKPHLNSRMGLYEINNLVKELNQSLLDKGYVTSQVVIPEQNIQEGNLKLALLVGKINKFVYAEDSSEIYWNNAFPIEEGDVLNIRDLEEGIEQMKRVSSQDVTMKLLPSQIAGMTDVELNITRTKPVHVVVSVDDSGLKNTGTIQVNGMIGIDQLLGANDIFSMNFNFDGSQQGYAKGTRGRSIYYSLPFGKSTFTFQHNNYKYHQTVKSNPYDFLSSGRTNTAKLTWQQLIKRTQTKKISWDFSLSKRDSHSYINDLEIDVQRLDTTALELGISERKYMGQATLYKRIAHKVGVSWFGAQPENSYQEGPKTRYNMWLFSLDYRKPFTLGKTDLVHTSSLYGQWTMGGDRLYGADMLSMGNRYTVRGFDGEYTLMSESGWYLRNELAFPLRKASSEIYVGLDAGAVYGPSSDILVGKTIAGTALGIRGQLKGGIYYEGFIGASIYKPQGYHTSNAVAGFTVSYRF